MLKYILFFFFTAVLFSCKTQDYLTPYEYTGPILTFGKGGGFSGQVTQYTLLSNGQLFKGTNLEGNVTVLDKLEKSVCEQVFLNYKNLGFADLDINDPGNMYFYLKKKEGDDSHQIKWGGNTVTPPDALKVFHKNLMALAGQSLKKQESVRAEHDIK